jgi:hypothetical protein
MRLKFKGDVHLLISNLNPEVVWILQVAIHQAPPLLDDTMVVTSAADGSHSEGSRHYPGLAWDIRYLGDREGGVDLNKLTAPSLIPLGAEDFAHLQREHARQWAKRAAQTLGSDYDVVLEPTHIHIEWDS